MPHPLDNPIWAALTSRQSQFARINGHARRFAPEVTVFAAIPNPDDPVCWADLATLLGAGGRAALFMVQKPQLPASLATPYQRFIDQMLAPESIAAPGPAPAGLVTLGPDDVVDMLDLAKRTEPGPLQPGTIDMGTYLGIRGADGRLLAMAGERLALDGHVEISAVCTDPEARGRGLASALCHRLAHAAQSRGDRAFLHVKTENGARRVYERLGFTLRSPICLTVVQVA